jgi:hypothetical protein
VAARGRRITPAAGVWALRTGVYDKTFRPINAIHENRRSRYHTPLRLLHRRRHAETVLRVIAAARALHGTSCTPSCGLKFWR